MNWNTYRRHYTDFLSSMYRAEIVTYYAHESIPNTEVKQPQSGKEDIPFFANLARRSLAKLDAQHRTDHKLYNTLSGIIFREDKERYLCYQELPLILAHMEAFLGQTLTAVWESDPSMLEQESIAKKWLEAKQKTIGELGQEEYSELVEDALFDIFRKSYDSCFYQLSKMGITNLGKKRRIIVASNMRNAIIHNGGQINNKYLAKLSSSEKVEHETGGYVNGSPIPINYSKLIDIFNDAVVMCENVFVQVSRRYFSISEPLKKTEISGTRQSLDLSPNPLEQAAEAWARKFGSAEEALAEMKRLQALGFSASDILLGRGC